MTASEYIYSDAEAGQPVELTEEQSDLHAWGQYSDNPSGGYQVGSLSRQKK